MKAREITFCDKRWTAHLSKDGPVYIFFTQLVEVIAYFKELWMKAESARSNLRSCARSTCEYSLRQT